VREAPGPSFLDEEEPGALHLGDLVRAFHATEDLVRLRGLLRRLVRSGPRAREERIPADAVDRLLEAREEEIDVARGALLIAHEDETSLDVVRAIGQVERLARLLRERLRDAGPEPFARLAAFNTFLFDERGFTTEAAPDPAGRLSALHLAHVLRRGRGHCLGLSVLSLALGARAGLPIFGVSCPGHFFVRYDDGHGLRVNLEMTLKGASFPDGYYVERYRLSKQHVDSGLFLGNLAKREVLVEMLNNRANCYWDLGDATRAARDLDRVSRASSSFAPGFAGQGFLALQRGDLSLAMTHLRRAIEIDPSFGRAYLHLGDALLRAGQPERAAVELEKAVALDPGSALAHTNLGRVHARRGDLDAAIAAHLRAIELDPRCHVAWNNLGVSRRSAGNEAGAREAFHGALAIAPRFLAALENLALVEREAGHRIRAAIAVRGVIRAYERRLGRTPDDAGMQAALARFLVEVGGDLDLAEARAERACSLAPESPRAWEALALVLRKRGDYARAVRLLERAVALAPIRAGAEQPRLKTLLESTRLQRRNEAPQLPPPRSGGG
jgi:tetratricopeptide (TPR) repeat protein